MTHQPKSRLHIRILAASLLVLSVLTTIRVGALHDPVHKLHSNGVAGLTYALILLGILAVHELGHFSAARWRRMAPGIPLFIPSPFGLGTFGAFVQLKTPIWDRNDSFDIGAAGPIAGLAVAIPLMLYSIHQASASISPAFPHGLMVRSSLLLSLIFKAIHGGPLPTDMVGISDLGFASWIGIFVSALNLLPVGPLDGGRIINALRGCRKAAPVQFITVGLSALAAVFVWSGLFLWTALLLFLALLPPSETLEEFTAPTSGRQILGYVLFLFALLVLIPAPGGVRLATFTCPYM